MVIPTPDKTPRFFQFIGDPNELEGGMIGIGADADLRTGKKSLYYRPEGGSPYLVAIIDGTLLSKNNLDASVAPTVDDDIDAGYDYGSLWLDTVAGILYMCKNPAPGAALWSATTGTLNNGLSASEADGDNPSINTDLSTVGLKRGSATAGADQYVQEILSDWEVSFESSLTGVAGFSVAVSERYVFAASENNATVNKIDRFSGDLIDSVVLPINVNCLECGGGYLFAFGMSGIYRLDPETLLATLINSDFSGSNATVSMCWYDDNLVIASGSSVLKVLEYDGTLVSTNTLSGLTNGIMAVAMDATYFYVADAPRSSGTSYVRKYVRSTLALSVTSVSYSASYYEPERLQILDGALWLFDGGGDGTLVLKLNISDLTVEYDSGVISDLLARQAVVFDGILYGATVGVGAIATGYLFRSFATIREKGSHFIDADAVLWKTKEMDYPASPFMIVHNKEDIAALSLNTALAKSETLGDNPSVNTDLSTVGLKRGSATAGADQYVQDVNSTDLELVDSNSISTDGNIAAWGGFFYTTSGTTLQKRSMFSGTIVDTVTLPFTVFSMSARDGFVVLHSQFTSTILILNEADLSTSNTFTTSLGGYDVAINATHVFHGTDDGGSHTVTVYEHDGTLVDTCVVSGYSGSCLVAVNDSYIHMTTGTSCPISRFDISTYADVDIVDTLSLSDLETDNAGNLYAVTGSVIVRRYNSSNVEESSTTISGGIRRISSDGSLLLNATTIAVEYYAIDGFRTSSVEALSRGESNSILWKDATNTKFVTPGMIERNESANAANAEDIATNAAAIVVNAGAITDAEDAIDELQSGITNYQLVTTSTADIAVTTSIVCVDCDTIGAACALTMLTAGIVVGRKIKIIAFGSADLYNVSIVCEGGEYFNLVFDTYLMDKENQTASFQCVDGGLILERN